MNQVPPPTKSSYPGVDHLSLFDAFQDAFRLHLEATQWPESDRPVLVQDYPREREGKFDTRFDVILYRIAGSEMATLGSTTPLGPSGMFIEDAPDKTGYKLVKQRWVELVTVEFAVHAKSNRRANELANWFHQFVMLYAFGLKWFKARGVNYFAFAGRTEDRKVVEYGQDLYVRPLLYRLHLELKTVSEAKTLEKVMLRLRGNPELSRTVEI